jgi:hypothetical protein
MRRNVAEGRDMLRTLLLGPRRFAPIDDGRRRAYAFEGAIALDRLIAGVVNVPTKMASPRGCAARWRPIGWRASEVRGFARTLLRSFGFASQRSGGEGVSEQGSRIETLGSATERATRRVQTRLRRARRGTGST